MTATKLAWDQEAALRGVDDDPELLAELAALFLEHSTKMLADVASAVKRRDAVALQKAAHTLKGSVANFAADGARQAAFELEMAGSSGDLADADPKYRVLAEEMGHV